MDAWHAWVHSISSFMGKFCPKSLISRYTPVLTLFHPRVSSPSSLWGGCQLSDRRDHSSPSRSGGGQRQGAEGPWGAPPGARPPGARHRGRARRRAFGTPHLPTARSRRILCAHTYVHTVSVEIWQWADAGCRRPGGAPAPGGAPPGGALPGARPMGLRRPASAHRQISTETNDLDDLKVGNPPKAMTAKTLAGETRSALAYTWRSNFLGKIYP